MSPTFSYFARNAMVENKAESPLRPITMRSGTDTPRRRVPEEVPAKWAFSMSPLVPRHSGSLPSEPTCVTQLAGVAQADWPGAGPSSIGKLPHTKARRLKGFRY